MYSSSFTQPSALEQQNPLSWYPQQVSASVESFQPSTLASQQQQQQIDYLLQQQDLQQQRYHTQEEQHLPHIPNIHQQQSHVLPTQAYNNSQQASAQQAIASYSTQQPQVSIGQQQHGFQAPSNHHHHHHQTQSSQLWQQPQQQQLAQKHPQQQICPQNIAQYDAYPPHTQSFAWSNFQYNGVKDMVVSPVTAEAPRLGMLPVVVNPAHLHTPASRPAAQGFGIVGSDFDGLESTDEDDEARLQLAKGAYPVSTPPLSPHIAEYTSSAASQGIMQSLAGFSVSPNPGFLASPTFPTAPGTFNVPALQAVIPPMARNKGGRKNQSGASESILNQQDAEEQEEDDDEEEELEDEEDEDMEHEDERQFKCHECPKRFLRQYNLNAHLKTHLLLRAHMCDECPRAFLRPYDLSRHQRIHSKDKPYSCRICNMTFIRNDAIWRHYRKVHPGHPDVPISRRDKMRQKSKKTPNAANTVVGATISSGSDASSSKAVSARKRTTDTDALRVKVEDSDIQRTSFKSASSDAMANPFQMP
ncbi:hypothetical protein BGX34_010872 [Mortierella sp. NVP85]|nr:hypothetical protein BGX34_010872 [Mortierella sp. NVP85]